jgi:3alpha(or 20beta)-hydroxysteroid dehydrogenase
MSPTARHGLKWWRKRSSGSARVDALVNNAAMFNPRPLIDTSAAEIRAALPGESTWRLSREAVIGPMKAAKAGAIVNISSVSGLRNIPVQFAYAASKWAVRGMTGNAAAELAHLGIRVNSVYPGLINTAMLAGNFEETNARFVLCVANY